VSPILQFARARQVAELAPADADALGIREGDRVDVRTNGSKVRAGVKLRASIPPGTVFLAEATAEQAPNALTGALATLERVPGAREPHEPSAVPMQVAPAADRSEMPPSAPLPIPPRELT
jgi:NADH-quinone oxidoreductase subunit G